MTKLIVFEGTAGRCQEEINELIEIAKAKIISITVQQFTDYHEDGRVRNCWYETMVIYKTRR